MARTRRIFISDIHLGTGEPWDWYQADRHEQDLLACLDWVAQDKGIKDLVLLGDVFDTWLCPFNATPPTVQQIMARHPKVMAALRACVAALPNVFYVTGNHDMGTTQADWDSQVGAPGVKHIPVYQAGLLYAEHGHRFAMFNAEDRMHDPVAHLPVGYFVTRILAGDHDYLNPGAVVSYTDDLLEAAFTTQTITTSLLEALMERTGRKDSEAITMPNGRPTTTFKEVKQRYAHLFDRWVEKFGHQYALNAIRGELNALGWFADRLCERKGYRVVVLGHSHRCTLDKDSWFIKNDRVYANSGYFCPKPGDKATFVSVKKARGFEIELYELSNGKPILREKKIKLN